MSEYRLKGQHQRDEKSDPGKMLQQLQKTTSWHQPEDPLQHAAPCTLQLSEGSLLPVVCNGSKMLCKQASKINLIALFLGQEVTTHKHTEPSITAGDTTANHHHKACCKSRSLPLKSPLLNRTEKNSKPVASELVSWVYITMSHQLFHFKYCLSLRGIVTIWL